MTNLSYNGQFIQQRETDGYVNGTQMCQIHNKRVSNWLQNDQTEAYIQGISRITGITGDDLVISKPGAPEFGGGTWIHPKLDIELGRWISVDFADRKSVV